jgi:hypothetical protein
MIARAVLHPERPIAIVNLHDLDPFSALLDRLTEQAADQPDASPALGRLLKVRWRLDDDKTMHLLDLKSQLLDLEPRARQWRAVEVEPARGVWFCVAEMGGELDLGGWGEAVDDRGLRQLGAAPSFRQSANPTNPPLLDYNITG